MDSKRVVYTSSMRRQHLLVEFSGLKHTSPEGIFLSLTPGDPALWSGVIFVRRGPYAPAILRFQISFPLAYPILPPLITFSTDLFHPLIAPLTTYMYTTDTQDSGTVSATDDERLPPGGFSLRHGFPSWFGRAGRSAANSQQPSVQHLQTPRKSPGGSTSGRDTPESITSSSPTPTLNADTRQERIFTYEVLKYIRSTFDDAEVLDMVPLEAAGNPGAWHAWRTYRLKSENVLPPLPKETKSPSHGELSGSESDSASSEGYQRLAGGTSSPSMPRRPGEWNWDGVWEVRAKKGIDSSISEPVLYGNLASNDELIRFLNVDEEQLEAIKKHLMQSIES